MSTLHRLRVCSFNVGMWTDGTRPGLTADEITGRCAAWEKLLNRYHPDLLLCEEATLFLDKAGTAAAYPTLFARHFPCCWSPQDCGAPLTKEILLLSRFPILHPRVLSFSGGSGRPLVSFETDVGGKTVRFFVTHLSIEAHSGGIRQQDLTELAALLRECGSGVLTGDFNTYSIQEFERPFSGLPMANHGVFGDIETWPHVSSVGSWNKCLDNIIVTPDITMENVFSDDADLSDHRPLFADLLI